MKRRLLILCAAAAVATSAWFAFEKKAAPPQAPGISKADEARQARIAQLKKDGIILAAKKDAATRAEEKRNTASAQPSQQISLLTLDLSRPPTERELIKAGQLRGPLSPTAPADPAAMADPVQRAWQEQDNLTFGTALQAWNDHQFDEAMLLFLRHAQASPQSPWAAESRLHLALAAQEQRSYLAAHSQVEQILKNAPKGTPVYQKAMMLEAKTLVLENRHDEAAKLYFDAMRTETDGQRKKLAEAWLRQLSQFKNARSS